VDAVGRMFSSKFLRNGPTGLLCLVAAFVVLIGFAYATFKTSQTGDYPSFQILFTLFSSCVFWIALKVGLLVGVEIKGEGFLVRNFFQNISIPFAVVKQVRLTDHIEIVVLDGRRVSVSSFAPSLYGNLKGNSSYGIPLERIQRAVRENMGNPSRGRVIFRPNLDIWILAPVFSIFFLVSKFITYMSSH
jgi:hypothetical protein